MFNIVLWVHNDSNDIYSICMDITSSFCHGFSRVISEHDKTDLNMNYFNNSTPQSVAEAGKSDWDDIHIYIEVEWEIVRRGSIIGLVDESGGCQALESDDLQVSLFWRKG